jgi:DNA-binding GntR family transcriptional regulator
MSPTSPQVPSENRWPLIEALGTDGASRLPLSVTVTSRIREEIVFGALAPGVRLTENDLCARYSVSRTPIREALRSLEAEGTVQRVSATTIVVPSMSRGDATLLYRTCATLEGFSARLLVERAREAPELLRPLEECLSRLERATLNGDPLSVLSQESEFHNTVLALSENHYAIRFMTSVQTILNRYGYFSSLATPERVRTALTMHNNIMAAIRSGNGDAAEDAVRQHIMIRLETLHAHWPAGNDQADSPTESSP